MYPVGGRVDSAKTTGHIKKMSDLLDQVLAAHGGLDRWRELTSVRATIVTGASCGG
jgi:uncharacterized membrane protein YoaK (UPF0700 family)